MRWFWPGDGLVHEVHDSVGIDGLDVQNAYCNMVHGSKPVLTEAFATCLPCIAFKAIGRMWLEDWHYWRRNPR